MLYKDDVPHVEVGVQVSGSFDAAGHVVASTLPGGLVATATHTGPIAKVGDTHQAVCVEYGTRVPVGRFSLGDLRRSRPGDRRLRGGRVLVAGGAVAPHRGRMTIVDMKIEVVQVPVSDVDRAKDFYSNQLGFDVTVDTVVPGGERVVQLTPPGSGCSIHLVGGGSGPLPGLTLVVADVEATHAELTRLGAPLSGVVHYENGVQVPGRSDEPWSTMAFFSDPDGNYWIIQERPAVG